MAIIESPDYRNPACESAQGNANIDILRYTITGNESAGDQVKLRRRNEYNTYTNMRLAVSAAMAAAMTVTVGYLTREENGTDVADAFGAALDVNANTELELIQSLPVEVGEKHDLILTLDTDFSADAGKEIVIIAESVATAG